MLNRNDATRHNANTRVRITENGIYLPTSSGWRGLASSLCLQSGGRAPAASGEGSDVEGDVSFWDPQLPHSLATLDSRCDLKALAEARPHPYTQVFTVHGCQKAKATQVSVSREKAKQNAVQAQEGISLGHKTQEISCTQGHG